MLECPARSPEGVQETGLETDDPSIEEPTPLLRCAPQYIHSGRGQIHEIEAGHRPQRWENLTELAAAGADSSVRAETGDR